MEDKAKKPPLGLMPLMIHRWQRLDDINNAIKRYNESGYKIPKEWLAEKETLESWLQPESVENNKDWDGTGLIGVSIKGNVVNYENSAFIKLDENGQPMAIGMNGKIFLPEEKKRSPLHNNRW